MKPLHSAALGPEVSQMVNLLGDRIANIGSVLAQLFRYIVVRQLVKPCPRLYLNEETTHFRWASLELSHYRLASKIVETPVT